MRGREKFKRVKPFIIFMTRVCGIVPINIRIKLFEYFRFTKGSKGLVIRYVLLKALSKSCGDNVSIHPGVYLLNPQNVYIGDNVSIHPMCYLDATGGINIGNNVSIAHGVTVMSTTHTYDDLEIPIKDQPFKVLLTTIDENVWIGAKSTILAGIKIGTGSIVGANCVVTKMVPPNVIVAGVPAKIIRERRVAKIY